MQKTLNIKSSFFLNKLQSEDIDADFIKLDVSDRASIESAYNAIAHLKAKGVEMIKESMNYPRWGFISAFFRDPDGNLIELEELNSYPNF